MAHSAMMFGRISLISPGDEFIHTAERSADGEGEKRKIEPFSIPAAPYT